MTKAASYCQESREGEIRTVVALYQDSYDPAKHAELESFDLDDPLDVVDIRNVVKDHDSTIILIQQVVRRNGERKTVAVLAYPIAGVEERVKQDAMELQNAED